LEARSNDIGAQRDTRDDLAVINRMKAEIERNPLYSPSIFWSRVGDFHIELIKLYGMDQFKRTVSHHYQNWLMISFDDPQVRRLLETWSSHFHAEPLLTEIETPSHVGFPLGRQFKEPEYPLANRENREVYRLAVSLLWEHVLASDKGSILGTLEESEVGNPIRIRRQGRLISSDLAHSVRERNMLLECCSLAGSEALVVGELGAGHGRIAEVYGRTTNYRYMIFDIPPALYVAQWYIKKIFQNDRIFEFRHFDSFAEISEELKTCRFAFFTPNQIEFMPNDCFDLFYNMNSLMEMRFEQIDNFLCHIGRTTRSAFFSRQYKEWHNADDNITVNERHFQIGPTWNAALSETDAIHPRFFNHIWRKTNTSAAPDVALAKRDEAIVEHDALLRSNVWRITALLRTLGSVLRKH
jgi:putative sugar O-methyltransferase